MTNTRVVAGRIACALLTSTAPLALAAPAQAQTQSTNAPVRQFKDDYGVDLISGRFTATVGLAIGDEETGLAFTREIRAGEALDSMLGVIEDDNDDGEYRVVLGSSAEIFTLRNGVFEPKEQTGTSLTQSGNVFEYKAGDGTVAVFEKPTTT